MADKPHPKDCKCKGCMKKKDETVKESTAISKFISAMTQKNFAAANKYLKEAVNSKLKTKIQQCASVKPF